MTPTKGGGVNIRRNGCDFSPARLKILIDEK
jgi:hypothetical protein